MIRRLAAVPICLSCLGVAMNCGAAGDDVLLAELEALVDAESLSDSDPNSFRALPYESERFSGVMLGEGGGSDVRSATIRLDQEGIYRIHLGLYSGWGWASSCTLASTAISAALGSDIIF